MSVYFTGWIFWGL